MCICFAGRFWRGGVGLAQVGLGSRVSRSRGLLCQRGCCFIITFSKSTQLRHPESVPGSVRPGMRLVAIQDVDVMGAWAVNPFSSWASLLLASRFGNLGVSQDAVQKMWREMLAGEGKPPGPKHVSCWYRFLATYASHNPSCFHQG